VEKEGKTFSLVQKEVPLETAMAAAENYACKTVQSFFFDQGAKWRKEKASDKQLQLLDNLQLPHNPVISKGEAANLLNQYFNQPASERQIWYLGFHNLHPFPEVLSKKEAGQIIQKFKDGEAQEEKSVVPQYSLS
jgi:DNA-directed RNA polymerase subunit H (RpoH/RPB5)